MHARAAAASRFSRSRFFATLAVVLVVLIALWALGAALSWLLVAGIVAFGLIATIPSVGTIVLQSLCASVAALLALIGFNVAIGWIIELAPDGLLHPSARLPIAVGLVVALAVFAATAYFYLRAPWVGAAPPGPLRIHALTWMQLPRKWPRQWSRLAAVLLATLVIVGLPPLIAVIRAGTAPEGGPLPVPTRIGADLDVRIIAAGPLPEAAEIPPDPARAGFLPAYRRAVDLDVRFAVGFAEGTGIRWTRTGMTDESETRAALSARGRPGVPAPERRPGADGITVLIVDATPPVVLDPAALDDVEGPDDEVERWRSIALAAGEPKLPVVALLQTTNEARLRRWAPFEDAGEVVSVQRFGSQTVTDAAVRLGIGTTTGSDDYELAMRHRPILLFDGDEPVPRPLSIEQLFDAGRVRQCADLQSGGRCEDAPVRRPADLKSPGMHLVIDRPKEDLERLARDELEAWRAGRLSLSSGEPTEPSSDSPPQAPPDASLPGAAPPGTPPPTLPPGAAPVSSDDRLLGRGSRMYVNAVSVRSGASRLLYLDYWWYLADNPTRAVKGAFCGAGMVILGVTCFDHESDWEGLTVVLERKGERPEPIAVHYAQHESVVRYKWAALREHWDRERALGDLLARLPDHADRPVVWVARGTHAGYARRCTGSCRQVAADLEEQPHDGRIPWVGDDTAVCLRVGCLVPLPTAAGGRGPASWNAFAGPWGSRRCWLRYYCDSATPPPAPGQQERYRDPARYDGTADVADRDGGYEKGGH